MEIVGELQADGLLSLRVPKYDSFIGYFADLDSAWWAYSIVLATLVEMALVFYPPQSSLLVPVRIVFGLLLLGFLPGFSTMRTLLPGDPYPPLERILLSMFLSVVISIALGVILGVRYFFTGESSVVLIGAYTIALAVIAAYRRYSFLASSS